LIDELSFMLTASPPGSSIGVDSFRPLDKRFIECWAA
jgi:hypothetical protein